MCLVVGQVTVGDPKLNSAVLGKALSFGQGFCDLLLIVLIFLFSVPFFFFFSLSFLFLLLTQSEVWLAENWLRKAQEVLKGEG